MGEGASKLTRGISSSSSSTCLLVVGTRCGLLGFVAVDKNEAARYFKMSAEKGCVEAMFNYGRMLDTGDGIPADKKEAERYIKMAADQGCPDADKYFE